MQTSYESRICPNSSTSIYQLLSIKFFVLTSHCRVWSIDFCVCILHHQLLCINFGMCHWLSVLTSQASKTCFWYRLSVLTSEASKPINLSLSTLEASKPTKFSLSNWQILYRFLFIDKGKLHIKLRCFTSNFDASRKQVRHVASIDDLVHTSFWSNWKRRSCKGGPNPCAKPYPTLSLVLVSW